MPSSSESRAGLANDGLPGRVEQDVPVLVTVDTAKKDEDPNKVTSMRSRSRGRWSRG